MGDLDNSLIVESPNNYSENPLIKSEIDNDFVYCAICNANYVDASEFEQHNIETHGLIKKNYQCLFCSTTFRRQDHLKRHITSVHTSDLKILLLKCPVCDEEFPRRDLVLKHLKKKHEDAQSFECRICLYKTASLDDLETHNNSNHNLQKKHKCSYCKKPFKRRDHMLRHIKTLHLNQYTVCPICCQHFKRKDHVVRHCREKHSVEFLNGKIVKLLNENGISQSSTSADSFIIGLP